MPRVSLSSFDIAVVVRELNDLVKEAFIDNIYHLKPSTLLIKLRSAGSTNHLLVEAGRRVHLTWYPPQAPDRPTSFCMSLRKWLRNGRLVEVDQPESERIVVLKVSSWGGALRLVLELFGKGNIIMVSETGEVLNALLKRRMKDRSLIPGEGFRMPPKSGINPWNLTYGDLQKVVGKQTDVIRALGSSLGVTSPYSDEMLISAGIDPATQASALTEEQLGTLLTSLRELTDRVRSNQDHPRIIIDSKGEVSDVVPFPMRIHAGLTARDFPSFNQALDEYFVELTKVASLQSHEEKLGGKLLEQERIAQQQLNRLEELKHLADDESRTADLIMSNLPFLSQVQNRIISWRREGLPWDEILKRLSTQGSTTTIPIGVVSVDPGAHTFKVEVSGSELTLDFLRPPQEEAGRRYLEAKEARRKIIGLEAASKHAMQVTMELRNRSDSKVVEVVRPERRREKPWYARFHYFISSEGFMVVAGKDAGSNEALVKRHVEPHDIIFHSEAPGAPFVVVKTGGRKPGESTIHEAATFTICHSKAWRQGFGSSSAFYVSPDQVSKKAPSGEYLTRGSFMVIGVKNQVRGVPLRHAVGVMVSDGEVECVGGPEESVKNRAHIYAVIIPGDWSAVDIAKELAARFTAGLRSKGLISPQIAIQSETLREIIPAGKGRPVEIEGSKP